MQPSTNLQVVEPKNANEFFNHFDTLDIDERDRAALKEMYHPLRYFYRLTDLLGLSYWKRHPPAKNTFHWMMNNKHVIATVLLYINCLTSEILYARTLVQQGLGAEYIIAITYPFTYAILGSVRLLTILYYRGRLQMNIEALGKIWPRQPLSEEAEEAKNKTVNMLEWINKGYITMTAAAIFGFDLMPICIHWFRLAIGLPGRKVHPFYFWYPFDKFQTGLFELTTAFEALSGTAVVTATVSTNLLFFCISSHCCVIMAMLQDKLRKASRDLQTEDASLINNSAILRECIKTHQQLIKIVEDLHMCFALILLATVSIISINICCAGFTCLIFGFLISLPTIGFIISNITEMGILCYFGDIVMSESIAIGDAVYESHWYNTRLIDRNLVKIIIIRTRIPLKFTAMNFKDINLVSFSSILVTSYSYFTLLCKMYRDE